MTRIAGYHHLSFTVTEVARSAEWYQDVLGFTFASEVAGQGFRRIRLRHPEAGIVLTLTQHEAGSGDRFDERRTGLDHVAFLVPEVADVEEFARRFDELGVEHSGVKRLARDGGGAAVITLRDPDHIQLEVFCPGPG